jgi:uncharacterized repeat protein (TIGR03803 family)
VNRLYPLSFINVFRRKISSLVSAAALALTLFPARADVTFVNLYSFTNGPDGSIPQAGLSRGSSNDCFYGVSSEGGINSQNPNGGGVVFRINGEGALTPLYSFTNGLDGSNPFGEIVLGADGSFYGTTEDGLVDMSGSVEIFPGTIFKITPNGVLNVLYSFTNGGGAFPVAPLFQASDGCIYGTTAGFLSGAGTVFKITTNAAFTLLYTFTNGVDGSSPKGALAQGTDGNLYGAASSGGTNGFGSVFRITTNGVLTPLYSFINGIDGSDPYAGLTLGSDGNFYGTTLGDGKTNHGSIFKISPNGAMSVLYSFTNGMDGNAPYAGLVQGTDGNFYGATSQGGIGSGGVLFETTAKGVLTVLYSFTNGIDGSGPNILVQGTGGNFYGTTSFGGMANAGTIFRVK